MRPDARTVSGVGGNVTFANHYTAHVHAWSADIECEALEDTAWQTASGTTNPDLPWKTHIGGLEGFAGSFECYLDSEEVPEAGIEDGGQTFFMLRLYITPTTYYEGYAMCTGVHMSVPIEGISEATLDFQGSLNLMNLVSTTPGPVPTTTTAAP